MEEKDFTEISGPKDMMRESVTLFVSALNEGMRNKYPDRWDDIDDLVEIITHQLCVDHTRHFYAGLQQIYQILYVLNVGCDHDCEEATRHHLFTDVMQLIITVPQDILDLLNWEGVKVQ